MDITDNETKEAIAIDIEMSERSLYWFTKKSFKILEPKREFVSGWHLQAVCEHLQACYTGEIRELVINIPPRHMKSILASVNFNAWVWTRSPEKRFLTSSYAKNLAIRDSVKTRRIIQSPWYQARWGHKYKLVGDQNAKEKFENSATGYRLATSVGGAGTGEGGDYVTVDDPHKVMEAESKLVREGVIDWWDEEMSTRENDPKTGCRIIIMQRVHEADLAGHVLEQGGYVHLMLPAEYEPERKCITSLGFEDPRTEQGELLWKERFDKPSIDTLKRRLGSKASAGQLQQRPSPEEGEVIKRSEWKYYTELPGNFDKVGISADLTFKDGEKNDWTVFQVWGRVGRADKYLIDQVRAKMAYGAQLTAFKSLIAKWENILMINAKWIEDAANGAALVDTTKKEIAGVIAVPAKGSKIARAEAIAPQAQAGNLYLPDPSIAPWVGDFVEEWALFPNGKHDDQVDATSLGVSKLSEGINSDWAPISVTGRSKWLR